MLLKPSAVKLGRRPVLPYSTEVQQRHLTYTGSCGQEQPKLAGPMTNLPGPPVVRDEEAVPVTCPMSRILRGNHGHSRTTRHADSPANGQVAVAWQTFSEAVGPAFESRSGRRSNSTPSSRTMVSFRLRAALRASLRDGFASLDTAPHSQGFSAGEEDGGRAGSDLFE
jgi:hypothetical protein